MEGILPASRKICAILDFAVLVLWLILAAISFMTYVGEISGHVNDGSLPLILILIFLTAFAVYLDLSPIRILYPIAVNFVVMVAFVVGVPLTGGTQGPEIIALVAAAFVLFVLIISIGDRFRSVSSKNLLARDEIPGEILFTRGNSAIPFPPYVPQANDNDDGSLISKITDPKTFGILVLLFGVVLAACNAAFNGGAGNIVGFALFAVYGAFILFTEKDYSNWGRFKYVNRFIIIFGLSYILRGVLGGGEIDRFMSVVEGILLICFAFYLYIKVYRLADEGHLLRGRLVYTLVWFILVVVLGLVVLGSGLAAISTLADSISPESLSNMISAAMTCIVMAIVFLYFVLYCRPAQMYAETYENAELEKVSEDMNNAMGTQYTALDAVRDAHAARAENDTTDVYSGEIIRAFKSAGFSLGYDTEQKIRQLVASYYPNMTYEDAKKVVESIVSDSNQKQDYSATGNVCSELNFLVWPHN